jgi:serine/threonine protein kinase
MSGDGGARTSPAVDPTIQGTVDTIDSSALPSNVHADHDVPPGTAVGRYIVLHALGEGGNGVVYAAFDPELDRKVALKLVRPSPRNHARLLREAQALAKLSHPNVVAVHDVGTFRDRVFVAMELVEGMTLRAWLREPRSMKDILRVYLAAAEGLVAAHARGMVHRDFKPDNVLVSHDGHVRVVDFGLATRSDSQEEPAHDAELPPQLLSPITQAGALMGTPGYMAPEQYQRSTSDARTDQFSFCVALFEGLYGRLPFAGGTLDELQQATCSGRIRMPAERRGVPLYIQRAVEKGLSVEREKRWETMGALVAVLRSDPWARLRRTGISALVLLLVLGVAYAWWSARSQQAQLCSGAPLLLRKAWSPELRERIKKSFAASGFSYAEQAQKTVVRALDDFGKAWRSERTSACEATRVRGEQSEEVLAARLSCLDTQLDEARAFAQLMAAGGKDVVQHAVEASLLLPHVSDCADVAALLSPARIPADPRLRSQVTALRGQLGEARALIAAGAYDRALNKLAPLVDDAQRTTYQPLLAEALLDLGRAQVAVGDYPNAERTLFEAEERADESRADGVRGQAILERVEVTGRWLGHYPQAERDAGRASSVARRLAQPELEWAALDAQTRVHGYLGKLDQAVKEGRQSILLASKLFGASDLRVARSHGAVSIALAELGRFDEAEREDRLAFEISERALGPTHPALVRLLTNLATDLSWAGRSAEALPFAERAEQLSAQELGDDHPQHALSWNTIGYALLTMGKYRESFVANSRALAIYERRSGQDYVETVYPLVGMGEAALGFGEPAQALALLERASGIAATHDLDAETQGVCHFHHGRALWLVRHDRPAAVALVRKAVTDFRAVPRLRPALERAQAWLRELGEDPG